MKYNTDTAFVGIDAIKNKQKEQLTQFEAWAAQGRWKKFHESHYDWWMFPVDEKTLTHGLVWTVYEGDIAQGKSISAAAPERLPSLPYRDGSPPHGNRTILGSHSGGAAQLTANMFMMPSRIWSSKIAWSCLLRMLPLQDLAFLKTEMANFRSHVKFSGP